MKKNYRNLILFFLFVITTIDIPSFYIVYINQIIVLAVITILSIMLERKVNIKPILIWFSASLFLLIITQIQSIYLEHAELLWTFVLRVIFWSFCFAILYNTLSKTKISDIKSIISVWIMFYSLTLYLQFTLYYIFSIEIDYSTFLGGESSRIYNSVGFRPSGLTSEPSIYSGIMTSLLVSYYLINKKISLTFLIGLFSLLFTISTIGILLAIFLILTISLHKISIKRIFFLLLSTSILSFFIIDSLIVRYYNFSSGSDTSNNAKLLVIENLLSKNELSLFGYGMIGLSKSAPDYYNALYDLTLFGNLLVIFGLPLGLMIALSVLIILLKNKSFLFYEKILILISLIKVTIPNFIFFYLFFLIIIIINNDRHIIHRKPIS
ncbi:hypothetical protein [Providencia huaxiensis]|uniref:hypothetical protein n=1 Tax=Providencia huaxiensis TaxID=2027290 RepID=UPI0034E3C8E9